ncbi:DUF4168 domain-containing protein [Sphingomonas sp. CJ20]
MLFKSMAIGAALISAPAAFAQTTPTTPATPASPTMEAAPAAPAPTTPAPVSDAEVTQFASAALAVTKVQADAAVPAADKNAKSVEAITAAGIDPVRFNEISQAMRDDPALNQRIQKAAAALTQPAN